MKEDGKREKMTSNSIWYPGRVPTSFLENIRQDGNNDGHREPERVEDTEGVDKLDTWRGGKINVLTHNHTPWRATESEGCCN